jgi:hypothetical protein
MTAQLSVAIVDFKPLRRNTLVGFATIRINELKLVIHDSAVQQKGGGRWARPPAKPQLDCDGKAIRDQRTGKPLYAPVFEFSDWTARVAFSSAVVAALLYYAPNVFAEESTA